MAINKNHEFEELDGVKCAIVEKLVSADRVEFLKSLLTYNGYTVVVVASPAPKASAATAIETAVEAPVPVAATSYTVGVTNLMFNATNAIFGRLLKAPNGNIVTLAYWKQQVPVSRDWIPYYQHA